MPNIKKFLPAVTEIWVPMDGQTDTHTQLLDSPVVNNESSILLSTETFERREGESDSPEVRQHDSGVLCEQGGWDKVRSTVFPHMASFAMVQSARVNALGNLHHQDRQTGGPGLVDTLSMR